MIDYGRVTSKNQYSYIVSFIESKTVTIQDQTLPTMGTVGLIACSDQDARKKVIGKLSPLEVEITNVRRISDDATGLSKSYVNHVSLVIYDREDSWLKSLSLLRIDM